jgi:hypothetical protein
MPRPDFTRRPSNASSLHTSSWNTSPQVIHKRHWQIFNDGFIRSENQGFIRLLTIVQIELVNKKSIIRE